MKYSDAIKLRKAKENLLGKKDSKGFYYGDLLILPANEKERNQCLRQYVFNGFELNRFYRNDEDVVLWAIDTYHLKYNNILIYNNICH